MRALVVLLLLTGTAAAQGNAWHLPEGAEPGIDTMRTPVRAGGDADVVVYSGNQFAGTGGNPGNQTQAGSRVMYRIEGTAAWSEAAMTFHAQSGNNKYYAATLPGVPAGSEVEYYLRIGYSDHPTTFVYGADASSAVTLVEATAQAAPFRYVVEAPLAPAGAGTDVAGARLFADSGHVGLGDDVVLAPPLVRLDGEWRQLGAVLTTTPAGDALVFTQALAGATVTSRLEPRGDGIVRYEITDWGGLAPTAIELQAASPDGERFYGLGEKFDRVDQSGKVARMMSIDAPGDKGDRSYKVVPWFVSTGGYGVHLDSTHESRFDLRGSRADRWVIAQDDGALALHLIAGPAIADVLSRFTTIAGRPPAPPEWAFGPWLSSDHWRDGGEIRYVVETYRALGLAGSVFVFDSPWQVAYNDLTWNEEQWARGGTYDGVEYAGFASAAEMLGFLDDHGFKAVLWMTPFLNVTSHEEGVPGQNTGQASVYAEAAAAGYLVRSAPGGPPLLVDWWKGRGSPIDFTNPAARAWFQGRLAALVAASGGVIGGWKTDDGESDFIPMNATYFDGRTGAAMKNGYSVAYHGAVYEVLGSDGILWSRSGFTGTQAFPGHWAGDNEPNYGAGNGLPSVIVAGLSAAMSGWSIWGHDIGGYQDANPSSTPEDLFMRWTQFGALSPIMQIHRQVGAGRQYPWSYGETALENYRRYARLHDELFPYLYAYVEEAAATGLPILRPPVLLHPDDPATHGINHSFHVGDWLYAAPVIENEATARSVYLPAGTWFDWFGGEEHAGAQVLEWQSTDPMRMPLFVKAGAIVPMRSEVRVWPAGETSFGEYACVETAERITVTMAAPNRLRVRSAEPLAVRVDGAEVAWTREDGFTVVADAHGVVEIVFVEAPVDPDAGGNPVEPPVGQPGGCGCQGGGDPGVLLVLLVLVLIHTARAGAGSGRRGRAGTSPRR